MFWALSAWPGLFFLPNLDHEASSQDGPFLVRFQGAMTGNDFLADRLAARPKRVPLAAGPPVQTKRPAQTLLEGPAVAPDKRVKSGFSTGRQGSAEMSARNITSWRLWQMTLALCVCAATGDCVARRRLSADGWLSPRCVGRSLSNASATARSPRSKPTTKSAAIPVPPAVLRTEQSLCRAWHARHAAGNDDQPPHRRASPFNFTNAPSGLVPRRGPWPPTADTSTRRSWPRNSASATTPPTVSTRPTAPNTTTAPGRCSAEKLPVDQMGPNNNVDAQYFKLYYEQLVLNDLSLFIEAPIILNNPSGTPGPGPNTSGFGDLNAGFKWALYETDDTILTFQLKNYIAVGIPTNG